MRLSRFKKKYKALIVDVDGTLIPNKRDGMPSQRVTEAIAKASKLIHIGVATSRPYFMLSHIFDHLKLSGPSIINGGAQIIDSKSQKSLWGKTIDAQDFHTVKRILKDINISFFVRDGDKDITDLTTYTPRKLFCIGALELSPKTANYVIDKVSHIPTIAVHKVPDWKKGKYSIIISHVYATKQHGILEIAKILDINIHEIIAVGDGGNDMPLLMACGLKVAMGNAVGDLKAIADYIAPPVEEDGVADVIEKFVLNNSILSS